MKCFLRSYNGQKASKHFTAEKVREDLDGECSELIRRLGMGVNLFANTVESGLEVLDLFFLPKDLDDHAAKAEKQFRKTGIPDFIEWLRGDGCDFVGIVQYLNTGNGQVGTETETVERFEDLLKLLEDEDGEKMKALARMTDAAARIYGMSVHMMELLSLASKPKLWAKKVPEVQKQHAAVRKWLKDSSDKHLLAKAVAAEYASLAEKKRKRKADSSDSEDDDSDAASGEKSDSDSHDENDKKRRRRKGKPQGSKQKKDNRARGSKCESDSEDSDCGNKKGKKKKRQQQKTKKRGRSASGSSSDAKKDKKKKRNATDKKTKRRFARSSSSGNSHSQTTAPARNKTEESLFRSPLLHNSEPEESLFCSPLVRSLKANKPNNLDVACDIWTLADLQKVEEAIALHIGSLELEAINVTHIRNIMAALPAENAVRIAHFHNLPTKATDFADLKDDMGKVALSLETMVKDVRLAWVQQASKTLVPSGRIVGLMENLDEGPILNLLVKGDFHCENDEAVLLLEALAASTTPEERRNAAKVVIAKEQLILMDLLDRSTSTALYDKALTFAKTHRTKDPAEGEINDFLMELDVNVRSALGLNNSEKYAMCRKPDNWKEDIKRAFTYFFLTFRAWTP